MNGYALCRLRPSLREGQELYIGSTDNVEHRLQRHNNGHVLSTRHRRPFQLVHEESFPTRAEAAKRERFLKSGPDHAVLRSFLDMHSFPPSITSGNSAATSNGRLAGTEL
ncbi:MAG: GIY-YIG nuclease family protein [Bacteroidota bacterium]